MTAPPDPASSGRSGPTGSSASPLTSIQPEAPAPCESSKTPSTAAGTQPPIPPKLVESLLNELRRGRAEFVARRLCTANRPLLRELGDKKGVTRERIRQLEQLATDAILELLDRPAYAALKQRAAVLADEIGAAIPADSAVLRNALDRATAGLEDGPDFTVADFMLWLASPYTSSDERYKEPDGWLIRHDCSLSKIVRAFKEDLNGEHVVRTERFVEAMARVDLRPEALDALLGLSESWRRIDHDVWVAWGKSVTDKAEVVLELVGRPLAVKEINDRIGEGHSLRGLADRLTNDKRITRIDKRSRFALASWGYREYKGIANMLIQEIERAGGEIEFESLAEDFVKSFGVSKNSVIAFAKTAAFVREKGMIRLRTDSEPYKRDDRVFRHAGLFLRPNGQVVVHYAVGRDILRGSGRPLPEPAAAALGMRPGDRLCLAFGDADEVEVTWPTTALLGAALGSTRRVAEALGLGEGDDFRLILDGERGTCEAQRRDWSTIEGASGIRVEPGRELEMIADALGVIPALTRAHLERRGDHRLLELLP